MSQKNYFGNKAYKAAIKSGKSKDEAKQASNDVKREIDIKYQNAGKPSASTPSKTEYKEGGYDFDSDLNSNGTNWHTSEDL